MRDRCVRLASLLGLFLTMASASRESVRLDEGVRPLKYRLRLEPDLQRGEFSGRVEIDAKVERDPVRHLTLHAQDLRVSNLKLRLENGKSIAVESFRSIPEKQTLLAIANEDLPRGNLTLSMDFSGDLKNRIVGFYRSSYKTADGRERTIATSKFEPTYARQAFPCFDEPAMKAKFTVELVAPADYIALSNMDVNTIENLENGNQLFKFNESVPMSTYLACFIVCDFIAKNATIQNNNDGNFLFSVYATKDQIDKVDFSLEVGKHVTEYYIKYFNISYPLPKLDMIAIPDFVSGAMEHWGLVTFRETNLLYDEKTTSPANKQNIARVVAHEISHMWFGNLVTMKWWNDLWLNEGFASYMQYKALDNFDPTWKMLDQFLTANTHSILSLDSTLNSHPIVQKVENPDQITAIFDSITYNKGAAIIRMLENFVGEAEFQKGVTNYLNNHAYGNTITQDLLDELELVFNKENQTVTYIMDTWTKQMGYPVVHCTYDSSKKAYILTQKRFLADPENKPPSPSEFNDKWSIPITYRLTDGTSKLIWFFDNMDNVEIPSSNKDILKLNNDQVGYYRVSYDSNMWESIEMNLNDLDKTFLTASDRANILNDVFTLAIAKDESYELALNLSKYLNNEKEYVPWSVASSQFSSLKNIMSNSIAYIEFKIFVRDLLETIYKEMESVTDTDHQLKRLHQSTIYSLACSMGHKDCLSKAENAFRNWLQNSSDLIDSNLRSTFYYYGVQQTGEEEWLQLWNIFINEIDAQEKSKLMQALAASTDVSILKRYLILAWDEKYIRSQDHLSVLQYISANPVGTDLVWDHVREKWDDLVKKYTLNSRTLGTMIPGITRTFATQLKLDEMEQFFEKYPDAGAGATAREQAKENIKNNIKWLATHEESIKSWLLNRSI